MVAVACNHYIYHLYENEKVCVMYKITPDIQQTTDWKTEVKSQSKYVKKVWRY